MIAAIDNSNILRPWATYEDNRNPFSMLIKSIRSDNRKKKIINIIDKIKKS
jgi:hypothetical protein